MQKKERYHRALSDQDSVSAPPAPTWWGYFKAAANPLVILPRHPSFSKMTFLTSSSWFTSPMGILQFHKYFSFHLRCAGGMIVPSPLPLSLHQVLWKLIPWSARTLSFLLAVLYPASDAPVVVKPFTVKRSPKTWATSATLSEFYVWSTATLQSLVEKGGKHFEFKCQKRIKVKFLTNQNNKKNLWTGEIESVEIFSPPSFFLSHFFLGV
jgi:hypothetical protein